MGKQKKQAEQLVAQTAKLVDLVGYQEGTIVSRTILDKETGSVTLFAFDKGEGLSEHTTPYDALVFLLDGEAEITISGQPHRLTGGDAILMPGNQPHAVEAVERFRMVLTMIRT